MHKHRIKNMQRSSIECACGNWGLRLDHTVTLHGIARANYLLDSWLRHKSAEAEKEKPSERMAE